MGAAKKFVEDSVNNVADSVSKGINDVTREVGKGIKDAGNLHKNVARELENTYEANKEGINSLAGSAARIGAAYATGGLSETLGGGNYLTKQFGGSDTFKQIGDIGGQIASVSSGDFSGVLKNTAKSYVTDLAKKEGMEFLAKNLGQPPAPAPENYVEQSSQGSNQDMSFMSDLGDMAIDYGKKTLGLTNGSARDRNIPAPAPQQNYTPPSVITVPAAPQKPAIDPKMMMIGGGVAGLLVLALVLKK